MDDSFSALQSNVDVCKNWNWHSFDEIGQISVTSHKVFQLTAMYNMSTNWNIQVLNAAAEPKKNSNCLIQTLSSVTIKPSILHVNSVSIYLAYFFWSHPSLGWVSFCGQSNQRHFTDKMSFQQHNSNEQELQELTPIMEKSINMTSTFLIHQLFPEGRDTTTITLILLTPIAICLLTGTDKKLSYLQTISVNKFSTKNVTKVS